MNQSYIFIISNKININYVRICNFIIARKTGIGN